MNDENSKNNVRSFLSIRLKSIVDKIDILSTSNHCDNDVINKEFQVLKNSLLCDLNMLYNDENIKLEFSYDIAKDGSSVINCKALNNFSYYLLNGYDYTVVKNMNVTGDNMVSKPYQILNDRLDNNFRKYEL